MTSIDHFLRQSSTRLTHDQRNGFGLRAAASASLVAAALLVVGCGPKNDGPATVPVSGVLTVDGSPVEGASVTFLHETFAAFAKTDAEGRFELVPGAVVGENKVYFSKWEGGPPGGEEAGYGDEQLRMMAESGAPNAPKQVIPAEYTDANTTLTFQVPEEGTEAADFAL